MCWIRKHVFGHSHHLFTSRVLLPQQLSKEAGHTKVCNPYFLGTEIKRKQNFVGRILHARRKRIMKKLILIACFFAFFPSLAVAQSLEISATIGGFKVTSRNQSISRDSDEYLIRGYDSAKVAEASFIIERARDERRAELVFCVDKAIAQVVASQPRYDYYNRDRCHCQRHEHCHDCNKPGRIPFNLGVQRWLNCEKSSFVDQCGRRWNWCPVKCVWVDP